jgi:hypothetical protein
MFLFTIWHLKSSPSFLCPTHRQTFFRGVLGSTWIYKPLFSLRMLTSTFRYDTGEVENWLYDVTEARDVLIIAIIIIIMRFIMRCAVSFVPEPTAPSVVPGVSPGARVLIPPNYSHPTINDYSRLFTTSFEAIFVWRNEKNLFSMGNGEKFPGHKSRRGLILMGFHSEVYGT